MRPKTVSREQSRQIHDPILRTGMSACVCVRASACALRCVCACVCVRAGKCVCVAFVCVARRGCGTTSSSWVSTGWACVCALFNTAFVYLFQTLGFFERCPIRLCHSPEFCSSLLDVVRNEVPWEETKGCHLPWQI